jgi:selenide, water dikinase
LADVLRQLPASTHPDLLVGFDTSDDAGIFLLPGGQALVQTVDFFTPIVDDPYAYGAIAAANALSDVYAMGGRPMTVLNIACFNPAMAPADVWAAIFRGAADKTIESGAAIAGGHSVIDNEPKFGMAVTGVVDPLRMFANTEAKPGDRIFLTKPLGTGIITTAAKNDAASDEQIDAAIHSMQTLNRAASELGIAHGVRCATDITGFGLAGHLYNVARASKVSIRINVSSLPLLLGLQALAEGGHVPGGAAKNREFVGDALTYDEGVPGWLREVVVDPQTSGGLALFGPDSIAGTVEIGIVEAGRPAIRVV